MSYPFFKPSQSNRPPDSLDDLDRLTVPRPSRIFRSENLSDQDSLDESQLKPVQKSPLRPPSSSCIRNEDDWLGRNNEVFQEIKALFRQAETLGSLLQEATDLQETVQNMVNQGSPSGPVPSDLSQYEEQADNIAQRLKTFIDASLPNCSAGASIPSDLGKSLKQDQEVSLKADQTADNPSQPSVADTKTIIDLMTCGFSRKKAEELVKGSTRVE